MLEGHCGRSVFFVMGVTDVDDKIIARARDRSVGGRAICACAVLVDVAGLHSVAEPKGIYSL